MPRDLPSTASLRAFRHAATTLSFVSAAHELHVSPSALSRQIQALERHLGVALFRRCNPGLDLTDAGRRYLEVVTRTLDALQDAQRALERRAGPLRVSGLESFSERWLVPRLPRFEAEHPGIAIELEATLRYADFSRDPVDVAIRFGTGPWEGLHGEPLVDLDVFPVCSPALRAGEPPLHAPEALGGHTLIHVRQVPTAWRTWLRAAGLPDDCGRRHVVYDHVGIALAAAVAGQGVALSTTILCAPELADGRLCVPYPLRVRSSETYHLVCRVEDLDDPRITALRDWLVRELA